MLFRPDVFAGDVAPFKGFHLCLEIFKWLLLLLVLDSLPCEVLTDRLNRLEVIVLFIRVLFLNEGALLGLVAQW